MQGTAWAGAAVEPAAGRAGIGAAARGGREGATEGWTRDGRGGRGPLPRRLPAWTEPEAVDLRGLRLDPRRASDPVLRRARAREDRPGRRRRVHRGKDGKTQPEDDRQPPGTAAGHVQGGAALADRDGRSG